MSCASCERRIETALRAVDGVHGASAAAPLSEVAVQYDPAAVSWETIEQAIRDAGYEVPPGQNTAAGAPRLRGRSWRHLPALARFLGLAALIAGFAVLLRYAVGFSFLPSVSQEMAYGMLFVVGLITSLHCVAMCGGIALTQAVGRGGPGQKGLRPSLLYNAGRVASYTIIGGVAGSVGSLVSLSSSLKGIVPVLAGAFMLFLGIRMLGIFPWLSRLRVRFPALLPAGARRRLQGAGPFAVGLLNGLMPCGPLQTMQVYALGTGSLLAGAFSMLVFSAATVPLMLGFGAASSLLSAGFTRRLFKLSGVLVLALGGVMLVRGVGVLGWLPVSPAGKPTTWLTAPRRGDGGQVPTREVGIARIVEGIQVVEVRADASGYHPAVLVLQNGIPARIRFLPGRLDLATTTVSFPGYTAELDLGAGPTEAAFDNVVADFTVRCGTDVLHGYVKVVEDLRRVDLAAVRRQVASYRPAGAALASCCGY
jgi:sulfite exporter TauE/SafE/copper chaperone CopZ